MTNTKKRPCPTVPVERSQQGAGNATSSEKEILTDLARRTADLGERDPFTALGIEPTDKLHDIRKAYFSLSKRYHPDLFARYADPAVKEAALQYFLLLNRAYKKLSNPAQLRRTFETTAKAGLEPTVRKADTERRVRRQASKNAQKRSSLSESELFGDLPQEPPAQEQVRSISLLMSDAMRQIAHKRYAQAIISLEATIEADPGHKKAKSWLCIVRARRHQMEGNKKQALASYRGALEHDPKNVEATKAVRDSEQKPQGLFSRLSRSRRA